jgi:tRNA-dihydrouridine synthase B
MPFDFDRVFASRPVILAPMEDVSDAAFRRVCRARGADICVTEFVRAQSLIHQAAREKVKVTLAPGDAPTAIQIYGSDEAHLAEAAEIAERAGPAYIDINCGCWIPKIARSGAGAGWLRNPDAMIAMAKMVVSRVSLPVTIKTRIGWGTEDTMPIVDLARRMQDVGVRALTVHCRTAQMGYTGNADWSWAKQAREVVSIPVIVNGDVDSASDCKRALELTGCAGVMIGRRAIAHPWIFREARAALDGRAEHVAPTREERFALCREQLLAMHELRGERRAIQSMRRHYPGYLHGVDELERIIKALNTAPTLAATLEVLAGECSEMA